MAKAPNTVTYKIELAPEFEGFQTLVKALGDAFEAYNAQAPEPDPEPAPKPTLEHREGEYVHQQDESGFDYLFQYADETWWIVRDAVVGSDDKRSRRDMADRMYRTVISHGFLSPGTITKAQPPEPTTFGYVGYVTEDNGDVWDVVRRGHTGSYVTYARDDGCWREDKGIDGNHASLYWSDIRALGTFTAVTR